jgi:hypothetical protein
LLMPTTARLFVPPISYSRAWTASSTGSAGDPHINEVMYHKRFLLFMGAGSMGMAACTAPCPADGARSPSGQQILFSFSAEQNGLLNREDRPRGLQAMPPASVSV